MEIQCTFNDLTFYDEVLYRCLISDRKIPENEELKFIGKHDDGYTNYDVNDVYFDCCKVTKVPQGLLKIFPNLNSLSIWNFEHSYLKTISKNDLVEYRNIKKFDCSRNKLQFLPSSLFEGFINLKEICFHGNKLKVIAPNILDGLDKLEYVDFRNNPNYDICISKESENDWKTQIEELKAELKLKYRQNSDLYAECLQREYPQSTYKLQKGFVDEVKTFMNLDDSFKDLKIQIEEREFLVHKILLAARSPTLAEILKNNPEVENLNLVDISVEIFEKILKFLYTDELPGEFDVNFMHLYAAAAKLKIKELQEYAAINIIQLITEENAFDILMLSNKFDHEEMRIRGLTALKKKYPNANLKVEFATNLEKINKFIEANKRKEEIDREIEKMLRN